MVDNQEIHTSVIRSGVLEHSWVMPNNHVVKVVAHSTASNQTTGRQYDLLVDGMSFFNVPKVSELGLKGNVASPSDLQANRKYSEINNNSARRNQDYIATRSSRITGRVETMSQQEADDLQFAISQSIEDSQDHLYRNSGSFRAASEPPGEDHDLLGLLDSDHVTPLQQQSN